ncbi:hypothetical protein NA57DRAFT_50580 [Rhizodiscina lignyota]|uniref:Uncharacterized protein n=1 Tax=Rhizodiscina lignyota TaxID=1504668 RepID=A0A9P4IT04_9PEZI|nr:hypothetical protein NA57DRAFT_50580 [Rhizodiscina lignyota]
MGFPSSIALLKPRFTSQLTTRRLTGASPNRATFSGVVGPCSRRTMDQITFAYDFDVLASAAAAAMWASVAGELRDSRPPAYRVSHITNTCRSISVSQRRVRIVPEPWLGVRDTMVRVTAVCSQNLSTTSFISSARVSRLCYTRALANGNELYAAPDAHRSAIFGSQEKAAIHFPMPPWRQNAIRTSHIGTAPDRDLARSKAVPDPRVLNDQSSPRIGNGWPAEPGNGALQKRDVIVRAKAASFVPAPDAARHCLLCSRAPRGSHEVLQGFSALSSTPTGPACDSKDPDTRSFNGVIRKWTSSHAVPGESADRSCNAVCGR